MNIASAVPIFHWPEMPAMPAPGCPIVICVPTETSRPVARKQLRAVLREILSSWSGLSSAALPLAETARGPVWRGELQGASLAVSFSYTATAGWLALCRGEQVGMDALAVEPFPEMEDVARDYLGAELVSQMGQATDRALVFAHAWTELEARLKCLKGELTEQVDAIDWPATKLFRANCKVENRVGITVTVTVTTLSPLAAVQ